MLEAYFYKRMVDKRIRCDLCNFRCVIENGGVGICRVRKNIEGKLYSLVYEKVIAKSIDPIEKKPLFHFMPGSKSYSIATVGCNFKCLFCQNSDISQYHSAHGIAGFDYSCDEVVKDAISSNAKSISYTYTEPTIFFEYAINTAKIAKHKGIKNIFVTNGYMTKEAINMMDGLIDAANVDLKAFSDRFYREVVGGARLNHVLRSIEQLKEKGIWLEITTLVIPGLNDSIDELKALIAFIRNLSSAIPWHVSEFYPAYKLTHIQRTPKNTIDAIVVMAKNMGLKYVYAGNMWGSDFENTYCYNCGRLLIKRFGFDILENHVRSGRCPSCGVKIDIVE